MGGSPEKGRLPCDLKDKWERRNTRKGLAGKSGKVRVL